MNSCVCDWAWTLCIWCVRFTMIDVSAYSLCRLSMLLTATDDIRQQCLPIQPNMNCLGHNGYKMTYTNVSTFGHTTLQQSTETRLAF